MIPRFDQAFRENAIHLMRTSGKSQKQLAKELDVSVATLGRWWRETETNGEHTFTDNEHQHSEELLRLRRENEALRKEIEILRQEGDALKRTVAIFSRI